jgi:hypothetical protein
LLKLALHWRKLHQAALLLILQFMPSDSVEIVIALSWSKFVRQVTIVASTAMLSQEILKMLYVLV